LRSCCLSFSCSVPFLLSFLLLSHHTTIFFSVAIQTHAGKMRALSRVEISSDQAAESAVAGKPPSGEPSGSDVDTADDAYMSGEHTSPSLNGALTAEMLLFNSPSHAYTYSTHFNGGHEDARATQAETEATLNAAFNAEEGSTMRAAAEAELAATQAFSRWELKEALSPLSRMMIAAARSEAVGGAGAGAHPGTGLDESGFLSATGSPSQQQQQRQQEQRRRLELSRLEASAASARREAAELSEEVASFAVRAREDAQQLEGDQASRLSASVAASARAAKAARQRTAAAHAAQQAKFRQLVQVGTLWLYMYSCYHIAWLVV
jgi:hypothetical protein